MKRTLIGLFMGLLVSMAPIGPATASDPAFDAGYEWAKANDVDDFSDCAEHSGSFREGCEDYVEAKAAGDEDG